MKRHHDPAPTRARRREGLDLTRDAVAHQRLEEARRLAIKRNRYAVGSLVWACSPRGGANSVRVVEILPDRVHVEGVSGNDFAKRWWVRDVVTSFAFMRVIDCRVVDPPPCRSA